MKERQVFVEDLARQADKAMLNGDSATGFRIQRQLAGAAKASPSGANEGWFALKV